MTHRASGQAGKSGQLAAFIGGVQFPGDVAVMASPKRGRSPGGVVKGWLGNRALNKKVGLNA